MGQAVTAATLLGELWGRLQRLEGQLAAQLNLQVIIFCTVAAAAMPPDSITLRTGSQQ